MYYCKLLISKIVINLSFYIICCIHIFLFLDGIHLSSMNKLNYRQLCLHLIQLLHPHLRNDFPGQSSLNYLRSQQLCNPIRHRRVNCSTILRSRSREMISSDVWSMQYRFMHCINCVASKCLITILPQLPMIQIITI